MKTIPVIVNPFDQFGSSGTSSGAQRLADLLQEAIEDTEAEDQQVRSAAYASWLDLTELSYQTSRDISTWRKDGKALAASALEASEFVVWLGGNHLSVLPVLESLPPSTTVLQLDAHLDCANFAETFETLSHGNFLKELGPKKKRAKLVHAGHRDLFMPPSDWQPYLDEVIPAEDFATIPSEAFARLKAIVAEAESVWLDIDVDVLDPAFAPAVREPAPFGLTPQQLLAVLLLIPPSKFRGLSLSEFDPHGDDRQRTLDLLGWFLERALLHRVEPMSSSLTDG